MEIREMTNKLKVSLNTGNSTELVKDEKKEETKEEHTPVRISVDELNEFDQVIETALKTTNDLCTEVNTLFAACFSDYEGCIIEPTMDPNNPFRLRLFFTYKGEDDGGKIKALDKVGLNKGETAYDRLTNFNIMQKNRVYNLTQTAKEALEEFIVVPQGKKINWNEVCVEFSDNTTYGRGQRFYMAITIDLIRFIRKSYGTKDANGGRLEYSITNIRPLGNLNTGNFQQAYIAGNMQQLSSTVVPNFLVGIMKLSSENLKEIAGKLGWIPQDAIGFAMVKA